MYHFPVTAPLVHTRLAFLELGHPTAQPLVERSQWTYFDKGKRKRFNSFFPLTIDRYKTMQSENVSTTHVKLDPGLTDDEIKEVQIRIDEKDSEKRAANAEKDAAFPFNTRMANYVSDAKQVEALRPKLEKIIRDSFAAKNKFIKEESIKMDSSKDMLDTAILALEKESKCVEQFVLIRRRMFTAMPPLFSALGMNLKDTMKKVTDSLETSSNKNPRNTEIFTGMMDELKKCIKAKDDEIADLKKKLEEANAAAASAASAAAASASASSAASSASASSNRKRPASPDSGIESNSALVDKHEELKRDYAKVRKICKSIGVEPILVDVLDHPMDEADICKSTKKTMDLVQKHGGPDSCRRKLDAFKSYQDNRYLANLALCALKPKDIITVLHTGKFGNYVNFVSVAPHADESSPTCINATTLFVNDGDVSTNKSMRLSVNCDPNAFSHCDGGRGLEQILDSVFNSENLKVLYKTSFDLKYTKISTQDEFKKRLWVNVRSAFLTLYPHKRGFFTAYDARKIACSRSNAEASSSSSSSITCD